LPAEIQDTVGSLFRETAGETIPGGRYQSEFDWW
jgi:hypothetical protein